MKVFVLNLALLLAAGALTMNQPQRSQTAVRNNKVEEQAKVTLNVFSGRRDPTWSLSKEQAESLLSIVKELPACDQRKFFDGLGYRGFQVTMSRPITERRSKVTVYRGRVRYDDGGNVKYLADEDRQIEQLLLKSGSPHLKPGLYKTIERQIRLPGK